MPAKELRDIFLVPLGERYFLVHAPLQGVTALVNHEAAGLLKNALLKENPAALKGTLGRLAEKLMVRVKRPARKTGPFSPRQLGILMTGRCNLRCRYCAPESGEPGRSTIPLEFVRAGLEYFGESAVRQGLTAFNVYFHGGEPFLPFAELKQAVALAREQAQRLGLPFYASASTNGVMSEKQAEWAAENFRYLIIALDGPADIQDYYRPLAGGGGAFQTVDRTLKIFSRRGLKYALRCTVERGIAARTPEIVAFYLREYAPAEINIEPVVITGRAIESDLFPPDPDVFVKNVIAADKLARRRGVPLVLSTARTNGPQCSNCELTRDQFILTPDGGITSCFDADRLDSPHFKTFGLGRFDFESGKILIDNDRVESIRAMGVESLPRCGDCFCKWHCGGGCRLYQTVPGSTEPPGPICEITQKLTLWRLLKKTGCEEMAIEALDAGQRAA